MIISKGLGEWQGVTTALSSTDWLITEPVKLVSGGYSKEMSTAEAESRYIYIGSYSGHDHIPPTNNL